MARAEGGETPERPGLPERPLGFAFLGCGFAARLHARTLRRYRDRVRVYFASRDADGAREYARRFGGAGAFGSYGAALEDPAVDVAFVTTPPASHLELVLQALRAGKDAIVEKPPFLHSGDFDAVEELQAATGRRVLVAENYHYKPLAVTLRSLLAKGAVGELRFVLVNALKGQAGDGWRTDPGQAGGGALFEGGIHWIDLMAHLGPEVRRVRAVIPSPGPPSERSALVSFEFAGGALGSLAYSWDVPSPLRGLRLSRIYGEQGSIAFESNGLFVLARGRRKRLPRLLFPGLRDISGYRAMFDDFLDALRWRRDPVFSLARARRDVEIVEAAYRSARRGAAEPVGA